MNNTSQSIGKIGEDTACSYLSSKGYGIVRRNYHSRFGEIDIIAVDNQYIVFVEVKARKKKLISQALEAVDYIKQSKIIKTALVYMTEYSIDLQPRFDTIEILFDNGRKFARHIKSAFIAEDTYEIF